MFVGQYFFNYQINFRIYVYQSYSVTSAIEYQNNNTKN